MYCREQGHAGEHTAPTYPHLACARHQPPRDGLPETVPVRESLRGPRREGRGTLKADYHSVEERGQALEDSSQPLWVLVTLRRQPHSE